MNRGIVLSLAVTALSLVACGPSPEDVCDHALTLAKAEVGDKAAEAALGTRDECVQTETRRKEMQGMLKYKENNACLMDSKSWSDVTKCKK